MRRLTPILLLLLLLCGLGTVGRRPVAAARPRVPVFRPRAGGGAVPGQWVMRFAPGASASAAAGLHARTGARVLSTLPQLGIQTVQLSGDAAVQASQRSGALRWMEPNRRRYALVSDPNDPAYNQQDTSLPTDPDSATWYEWDARIIQCKEGWDLWPGRYFTAAAGKGGAGVRLAVIDTGIDYGHPDFRNAGGTSSDVAQGGQLERALDRTFLGGEPEVEGPDEYGHGTHVAGIAAAATHNNEGVTGNGYNATVLTLKVLDSQGQGSSSEVAKAIVYAADQGALICNLSLGDYSYSQAEQDAVNYAWGKGTLVIAAAGNDGSNLSPNYPAALSRVLAVSATAREERLATYSNWGDYVGIAAPGGDFDFTTSWFLPVYSTMPTYYVTLNDPAVYGAQQGYDYLQGTSMAAPQVAGLAALYAGSQGWTQSTPGVALKLWQALQRGCDDIAGTGGNWDPYYGFGRINVYDTLNLALAPNPRGATAGCITGQVRFRGTPVANAVISGVPTGGGQPLAASSRTDGGYRLPNAAPGLYRVSATVFGETEALDGVQVTAGCDIPGIDFNVGGAAEAPGGLLRLPSRVRFGKVAANFGVTRPLLLRNVSRTETLRVTLTDPETPFSVDGGAGTLLIPARSSRAVTLAFKPTARGNWRKVLTLASSDKRRPSAQVSLVGAGK